MPNRKKNLRLLALICLAVLMAGSIFFVKQRTRILYWLNQRQALPEAKTAEVTSATSATDSLAMSPDNTQKSTDPPREENIAAPPPAAYNLKIPFTSQAPYAVWDHKDEEACEEAALLMAHRYYTGRAISDKDDARSGIDQIIEWEKANLGGVWESTTAAEVARIAKGMLGYQGAHTIANPDVDTIKAAVSAGNPVLVPAAGRELHNPFFKQPGPPYQMLVIKGYDEDEFITNDPGTRRGADYRYKYTAVLAANHDWNGGDVGNGAKVMIVLK